MSGRFDHSSFDRYCSNFKKMHFEFERWLFMFLMQEGMRFIADVKHRTPVDTGILRNAWALENVTKNGDELRCWFRNDAYYADYVEYGHAKPYRSGATEGSSDWVDGYFMMTVSLDEVYRKMPGRFDRELKAYLLRLEAL